MNEAKIPNGLPPNAKRVFKGVIFDVWQWEQKMFDGTTSTFERLWRPDTAQVIPIVGDTILLQNEEQPNRSEPFLSLSGGRCEPDEDPLIAARRELLEETGYESDDWVLWQASQPVGKMIWTIHTYIARNCKKTREPHLDNGEKIETKQISFDEFLTLSENKKFYAPELSSSLLRARFDPKVRNDFHKLLFGVQ